MISWLRLLTLEIRRLDLPDVCFLGTRTSRSIFLYISQTCIHIVSVIVTSGSSIFYKGDDKTYYTLEAKVDSDPVE